MKIDLNIKKIFHNKISENTSFWTAHNVSNHFIFESREKSLDYLDWRNSQYLFYEQLMPLTGFDDQVILDYGCGPGNDLVGFLEFSNPKKLYGMDISPSSLMESAMRLKLHDSNIFELIQIEDNSSAIPLPDASVDYIHTSGVLHHTPNIEEILEEFYRVLTPQGKIRIMVYHYESIWLHLYVAYCRQIKQQIDSNLPLLEAFRRSTDGESCPISRCYKRFEFIDLVQKHYFKGRFIGSAISLHEMSLLPERIPAIMNLSLPKEHRDFLKHLSFDEYGRPLSEGIVAGIDAVYELSK